MRQLIIQKNLVLKYSNIYTACVGARQFTVQHKGDVFVRTYTSPNCHNKLSS